MSELVDDGSGREFVFYKLRASNLWDTNQGGSLSFTNYDPKFGCIVMDGACGSKDGLCSM